ncbi:TPA: DUF6173 family protein [Klebsiella pneumoniae]|uniref:DUF6173 family protein n=1 Tax=Klebsiella pneumoniae TaxID=573 RepID=UPI000B71D747|nr:DUF6173 family protein [Klebsiella pneumoniae]OVW76289.1 hypothetical protein BME44_17305 [Klebsiella pneumoniae]
MSDDKLLGFNIPPIDTLQTHLENINKIPAPYFPKNQNLADEFHRRLICWINDFHRDLDNEHEVGGQLASFGRSIEFHFTDIGYWNPSLISFIGQLEDGSPVELIQHVNQINILLIKKKRLSPDEAKRPIGFADWPEYDAFKGDK